MELRVLGLLCCAAYLYFTEGKVKRAVGIGGGGGGVTCVVTGNRLLRNGVFMRELKPEEQTAAQNYHRQLSQWLEAKYSRSKLPAEPVTPSFCSIGSDQAPTPTAVDCSITDNGVYITWYNVGQPADRVFARNLTTEERAGRIVTSANNSTRTRTSPLMSALSSPCIVMHVYTPSEQTP
uniref:Pepsin inhibitor-3-like repeated domain-containing protein n=1 Tax=Plectus sambesii TaxID=2011161 RepID=A0A914WD27_9BILA